MSEAKVLLYESPPGEGVPKMAKRRRENKSVTTIVTVAQVTILAQKKVIWPFCRGFLLSINYLNVNLGRLKKAEKNCSSADCLH